MSPHDRVRGSLRVRDEPADETLAGGSVPGGESPTSAPILPVGAVINGRYRVLKVLGQGGMGIVYAVADAVHPDRRVALKTIRAAVVEPTRLGRFKAEFRYMAGLRHPNIARVYDFEKVVDSDQHLFTMEEIDGTDLLRATEGSSQQEVLDRVVEVCRALSYVHSRGLIHFDVKPDNVLVDRSGRAKVLDFGVAAVAAPGGGVRGTARYMAPELLTPGAAVDHRADLYSLGVMLGELLRRAPDRELAPWLADTVASLTANSAEDRPATANAVIERINAGGGTSYEIETSETTAAYLVSGRFVGRQAALDAVLEFVDARTGGRATPDVATFVSGPGGIGKSRLLREVRHRGQLARQSFFEATCYEGLPGHDPVADVLVQLVVWLRARGGEALLENYGAAVARIRPGLVEPDAYAPMPVLEDAAQRQRWIIEMVVHLLAEAASISPIVLCIDDLQWAPARTVGVLEALTRRLRLEQRFGNAPRLALLGSYRIDEWETAPLASLLRAGVPLQTIELGPLEAPDVESLAASMLGIARLPAAFASGLVREATGNPFFIEETMRAAVDGGFVRVDERGWSTTPELGEFAFPSGIRAAVERRLSVLPPERRAILRALALWARPVSVELLASSLERPADWLEGELLALRRTQLLHRSEERALAYTLVHDRIREGLYDELEPAERRALHGAVARALEAHPDEGAAHELAHHFHCAGDEAPALRYALVAAGQAEDSYSADVAATHFELARELLSRRPRLWTGLPPDARGTLPDDPEAASRMLIERSAKMRQAAGDFSRAESLLTDALRRAPEGIERARLTGMLGAVQFGRGDLESAAATLWGTVDALGSPRPLTPVGRLGRAALAWAWRSARGVRARPPHEDEQERQRLEQLATTYGLLVAVEMWRNRNVDLLLALFRALTFAERAGATGLALLEPYSLWSIVLGVAGFPTSAARVARQARQAAVAQGSVYFQGVADMALGQAELLGGNKERACETLQQALPLLRPAPGERSFGAAQVILWWSLFLDGRLTQARVAADEAVKSAGKGDQFLLVGLSHGGLCRVLQGEVEAGLAGCEEVVGLTRQWDDRLSEVVAECLLGWAYRAAGRLEPAIERFTSAERIGKKIGVRSPFADFGLPLWACTLVDPDRAATPSETRRALAIARRSRRRGWFPYLRPYQALAIGWAEAKRGRTAAAERSLLAALEEANGLSMPLAQGETHAALASWFENTQSVRAEHHRERARACFAQCEAHQYLDRV